jgi:hypothetical protein
MTVNPVLAAQYSDKNAVPLETVYANSGKKALWHCLVDDYEWEAVIASRNGGRGCPSCSGKVATPKNSLMSLHPDIAKYYHPTKNAAPVECVIAQSHKKVWWFCDEGHDYIAMPLNKVRQGDGCPKCSGRYATPENNLAVLNPILAARFDVAKNAPLKPTDVTPRTHTKVWWLCGSGHSWKSSPDGMHQSDSIRCPYCSNRYASDTNNLLIRFPDVAAQYDLIKNEQTDPALILPGSPTKRWWRCEKDHSWFAAPSSRTRSERPTGCPECSKTPRTSQIESRLRLDITDDGTITNVSSDYNTYLDIHNGKIKRIAVDIYGEYLGTPVVVEYDSWWWHSGVGSKEDPVLRTDRDSRKSRAILDAGMLLVRIRESRYDNKLPFLDIEHDGLLQVEFDYIKNGNDTSAVREQIYAWLSSR